MKTRRDFLKLVLGGIGAMAASKIFSGSVFPKALASAPAAPAPTAAAGCAMPEAPKGKAETDLLTHASNEAVAKRINFVACASDSKHTKKQAGQECSNCKFYKPEAGSTDKWAKCVPWAANKMVPAGGWCQNYAKNS